MSKFIELPTGHILDIEDIIFVSGIKTCFDDKTYDITHYEFNIIWANRALETLKYDHLEYCNLDREALKKELFNDLTPKPEMICE